MMRILTNEQMRLADKRTIEGGVSGAELMRRAGEAIAQSAPFEGKRTYIICGKGNNGGDGYSLAVILLSRGCGVTVFYTDEPKGDGAVFAEQYKSMGGVELPAQECDFKCDIAVDCLFGTGFHGRAEGIYAEMIDKINDSGAFVVSADIPSGLNGDNGRGEKCVNADITVAIQSAKLGHYLGKGKDVCGKLIIKDIGIDCGDMGALAVDDKFCARLFPPRKNNSNKGSYGRCAVIGGSKNYPGAIKLADMGLAALQSGCGLCTVVAPDFLIPALSSAVVENTLFPLSDNGRSIRYEKKEIDELAGMMKCIAIGPGIGGDYAEIGKMIKDLAERDIKLIIDADGLNCLSKDISILYRHTADILLTPHPMEMARLAKTTLDQVLDDPLGTATNFAKKYGVKILLKGSATIITDGEEVYLMKDGGPYLAKGGSGDVLTGVITGIAARGCSLVESAAAGAYICAIAGRRVSEYAGEYGTLPSQVAREIKRITDEFYK